MELEIERRERERLANMGTQRTEMEMEMEMERREREVLLATIGTKRRQKITHRPNERIGPNQCLMITELPMSLMCDSCGNRMPKCSKIAVIQDASIIGQERVGCSSWTKMHYDCTNPNCIAEITVKRKGYEIVVESGATSYFRPEDEKLDYFPETISYRSSRGNPAVRSSQASCNQGVTEFGWSCQVVASSNNIPATDGEPQG